MKIFLQTSANAPSLPSLSSSFLLPSLHEQNSQGKQNAKPPQSNNNPSGGGDYFKKSLKIRPKKLFVLQIVVHKIVTKFFLKKQKST
jgi:hypothetical protein